MSEINLSGHKKIDIECPYCYKTEFTISWVRFFKDDKIYLGHCCVPTHGGCGRHFDTEKQLEKLADKTH